jgi:hypothetical protein
MTTDGDSDSGSFSHGRRHGDTRTVLLKVIPEAPKRLANNKMNGVKASKRA